MSTTWISMTHFPLKLVVIKRDVAIRYLLIFSRFFYPKPLLFPHLCCLFILKVKHLILEQYEATFIDARLVALKTSFRKWSNIGTMYHQAKLLAIPNLRPFLKYFNVIEYVYICRKTLSGHRCRSCGLVSN